MDCIASIRQPDNDFKSDVCYIILPNHLFSQISKNGKDRLKQEHEKCCVRFLGYSKQNFNEKSAKTLFDIGLEQSLRDLI